MGLTRHLLSGAVRSRSMRRATSAAASSALRAAELPSRGVDGARLASSPTTATVVNGIARRHMSFGGGAGFKGMEGFFKQEKLRAKVEEALNAKAKAQQYLAKKNMDGGPEAGMPPPPWEAPPPPMGVRAMAEAKIAAAMNDGLLDNLQGKGKPLARDPTAETPWDVDAGQAALNRILKSAGYKPASVEAREAVTRARRALEDALGLAVARGAATVTELKETSRVGKSGSWVERRGSSGQIVDQGTRLGRSGGWWVRRVLWCLRFSVQLYAGCPPRVSADTPSGGVPHWSSQIVPSLPQSSLPSPRPSIQESAVLARLTTALYTFDSALHFINIETNNENERTAANGAPGKHRRGGWDGGGEGTLRGGGRGEVRAPRVGGGGAGVQRVARVGPGELRRGMAAAKRQGVYMLAAPGGGLDWTGSDWI